MTYESYAKNIRNAMVGIVVVVLSGLVGCPKSKDGAKDGADVPGALDPSDVIEIVVEEKALTIPEELRKVLGSLRTISIALVDEMGQLRAFSIDGVPRHLCAAGLRTCKEEFPSQELMVVLSRRLNAIECGQCNDAAGNPRRCNVNANMRPCSEAQYICKTTCKP